MVSVGGGGDRWRHCPIEVGVEDAPGEGTRLSRVVSPAHREHLGIAPNNVEP